MNAGEKSSESTCEGEGKESSIPEDPLTPLLLPPRLRVTLTFTSSSGLTGSSFLRIVIAIDFHGLSNKLNASFPIKVLIRVFESSPERRANSIASLRRSSILRPPTEKCARPAYINDSPKNEAYDPQNDDGVVDVEAWM